MTDKITSPRFGAITSKPQAQIAGEMAEAIKEVIFKYEGMVPLALAVGVLHIVAKDLQDEAGA